MRRGTYSLCSMFTTSKIPDWAADELENYLKVKPDHPDAEKIKRLISQLRLG